MKKKKKSKRNFKIGDSVTILVNGRIIDGIINDKDYALGEFRVLADRPGDMRVFWVSPKIMRLRRNYGE